MALFSSLLFLLIILEYIPDPFTFVSLTSSPLQPHLRCYFLHEVFEQGAYVFYFPCDSSRLCPMKIYQCLFNFNPPFHSHKCLVLDNALYNHPISEPTIPEHVFFLSCGLPRHSIIALSVFHVQLNFSIYLVIFVMDRIVFPPNSYVEALAPNVTVFGDRAFKVVIRATEVIWVEP